MRARLHLSTTADKAECFRRSVTASILPAGVEGREPILYPGVTERLRTWSREVPLAIASGSLRVEIEPVLAAEGLLEAVPVIVAAGDTPNGKPSADPYLRALRLLSGRRDRRLGPLEPSRCVAVEDSAWGIDAALAAGMTVIALTTSYPPDRLGAAHRVVGGFGDLDLEMMSSAIPPAPIRRNGSPSPSL